ncbi:hypothetical protein BJ165DRAFT_1446512 [Panaeolus papilionaceus]|nr:hypothetical protein BJ165DRAFT_1446512 [Panaeolus papilionaceus]
MASPTPNVVIPGFSPTNRWLLYTSLMFAPAQALGGLGSNSPVNIGFLAYNIYQQYTWYIATKDRNLHALSLLPVHLNFIYSVTYLGGVPSGNIFLGVISALGTSSLIVINTITAWISVKTNLPEGDGIYQFFFFGWRRLTKGWRIFFLLWQVGDTLLTVNTVIIAFIGGIMIPLTVDKEKLDRTKFKLYRDTAVLWGSVVVLVSFWPLILWMELIVKRNNIVSETDMIAVYLFIAQAVLMVVPTFTDRVWQVLWDWKMKRLMTRKGSSKAEQAEQGSQA